MTLSRAYPWKGGEGSKPPGMWEESHTKSYGWMRPGGQEESWGGSETKYGGHWRTTVDFTINAILTY